MEEDMVGGNVELEEKKKNGGRVLRPEELGDYFDLPSHLPTRGKKEVIPDGSERQMQKLQRLCEQQDKLLREQKVAKVNRVAVGEWNQSKQLVEIKVEKGKFWHTMGYHSNGKKYLYPEEGLFLLEMNVMELRHGKVPISVQQAYELMIPYQFSLEHYQVYCHLMRLGYITTRHKESDITDYEYRINLDQYRHRQKQAYKKVQGWFQQMSENTDANQQFFESDGDSGRDQKSIKSTGSVSFHGSGVSGKGMEAEARSSSSGEKVQLLPGSGVSSDTSSPDNDDNSSVYSDGPVEPPKADSPVPSINLLEFHKKYISSDNSVVSSSNNNNKNKSITNSHCEKQPKLPTTNSVRKQSRKRKLRESNQDTSTDDQVEIKQRKKVKGHIERRGSETKVKGQNFSLKNIDGNARLCGKETQLQSDGVKPERPTQIKTLINSAVLDCGNYKSDIHTIMTKDKDKNTRDDSGKDSESRRSSDGSVKEFSHGKWTDDTAMDISSHCVKSKSRSSDLGTDLSLDVDIDDVLGVLSPTSAKNEFKDGGECKYTPWNFKQISLPNLAQNQTVDLPQPEFLPDTIAAEIKERKSHVIKESKLEGDRETQPDILQELDKVNQLLKTSNELMESTTIMLGIENNQQTEESMTIAIGGKNIENVRRLFPSKPAAANWGEYKKLTSNEEQIKGLTSVIQSPVAHLWQGDVQPLVKPSDAVSTSYLLHKLQIIQNANLTSQHVGWPYNSTACQECKISFDVFQPDTGYKKSKPGQPAFKVVVSSVTDPIPDLATQAHLLKLSKPVQLLWAVLDTNSDVAFYSLKDIELPVEVTMGW